MTLKFNSVFPEIKDLKRDFSSTGKMFTRTIILLGEKYHQREVGVGCIEAVQVPLAPMNMSQLHIMKITVKNNLWGLLWPYIGNSVGDCLWDCDHVFVSRQFSSSPVWGWGEPTVMNFSSRKLPNLKTTTLEKMCWKTLWGRVWLYYFVCAKNVWGWVRGLNRAATPFSGLK